jgi:acetolactate synthase I/II/III large subunit
MASRILPRETTAQAYLELLKDRGIDVFLGNAGTDFASLVEAFARFEAAGGRGPRPLVVPHEFVAVSMAHGYYAAGGRPAAVMVHVNVGTGNAATAIINAARANVPILMSAGRTPVTEEGLPGSRGLHMRLPRYGLELGGAGDLLVWYAASIKEARTRQRLPAWGVRGGAVIARTTVTSQLTPGGSGGA